MSYICIMISLINTRASQATALKKYSDGDIRLVSIINKIVYPGKYIESIGKYMLTKPKIKSLLREDLPKISKRLNDDSYRFFGIMFITSMLVDGTKHMFGDPILHSRFGEGLEGNDDYLYASYFLVINGHKYHLGYDNRGSSLECEDEVTPEKVASDIKELVDLYEETC